jgi:hypothetical protein
VLIAMSEPSQFTAQQASDPATPAEVLAAIAEHRPDLRPLVAGNPTAYPGLLDWLGQLGDPAVDAALAGRAAGPATPVAEPPTTPLTTEPPATPAGPDTPGEGYPPPGAGYQPPGAGYPPPGAGYPPEAQPGGYPAAPGSPYGAPGYQQPTPYGAPTAPYGAAGAGYGGPPQKKSKAWLWILLAVIALLVIGGIVLAVVVVRNIGNVVDQIDDFEIADTYGDDPVLDSLWDACADGDLEACDTLYFDSPVDSEYEHFGSTCGDTTEERSGSCAASLGLGALDDGAGPVTPGALDRLR